MPHTDFIDQIKNINQESDALPFSVYSAKDEQSMANVPVVNPMLIVVLGGQKSLGRDKAYLCNANQFVFISDSPNVHIRNIPHPEHYFALIIEFAREDFEDFAGLPSIPYHDPYYVGNVSIELKRSLEQFVDCARWAPQELWGHRRKELLHMLCYDGHSSMISMVSNHKLSQKVRQIIARQPEVDIPVDTLSRELAMSESTLRRRLKSEGTTIQEIKDQVKLGLGVHLLQTTHSPISLIAERCGYLSQSRFSDRFKSRFGLTPSDLRKTKLTDLSEKLTASA